MDVGYVQLDKYMPYVTELEQRIGRIEATRRTGIGKTTWYRWVTGKVDKVQRAKIALVLRTLNEVRKNHEVRHDKDIKRGRTARGEKEQKPGVYDNKYLRDRHMRSRML